MREGSSSECYRLRIFLSQLIVFVRGGSTLSSLFFVLEHARDLDVVDPALLIMESVERRRRREHKESGDVSVELVILR